MPWKSLSGNIVVLTGAGISAESGIRTFRDGNGLWESHRLEDVATPEAFERNAALVQRFYNERRHQLQDPSIQPNAAHLALAALENSWAGNFLLVTQNVDDLHERAGSKKLLHMHGELLKMRCVYSGKVFIIRDDIAPNMQCDCCGKQGSLRPHIVWFGEIPMAMDSIHAALAGCTLFLSIGTSGNVYPAAGFVRLATTAGARTVEINLEPSLQSNGFSERMHGLATQLVPAFVQQLLAVSGH